MKKLLLALTAAMPMVGCTVIEEPARTTTVTRTVETTGPAVVTTNTYSPGYVVSDLPVGYRTVRVQRNTYYVSGDTYYRRGPRGYVVVERPGY